MPNPTDNPTPAPVKGDALPKIRENLRALGYKGRDLKNNAAHALSWVDDLSNPYPDRVEYAQKALPNALAAIVRDAEAIAAALPALRALTGAKGDAPAPVPKITDGGLAIVVQYRCPTDTRGARWTARFDRDAETVFRATAGFTFDDKDNEGADNAAAACLAKFEAYCNEPIPGVVKTSTTRFTLVARASLGRGAYAYTFRRI